MSIGSYKVKEVCEPTKGLPKGCPKRFMCVELIHVGYPCPYGLDKMPLNEARNMQRKLYREGFVDEKKSKKPPAPEESCD